MAVRTVQARTSSSTLPEGFSYSALTELVLFMLLCAVAACAAIVETRRLGLYERISAAPVSRRAMVGGEALNYLAIALSQSLLIVFVGSLAFGVSWGNPLAAGALLLATPQAWAVDAKTNLLSHYLSHQGTVAIILPELAILLAFATALLALATVRLRRGLE